MFDREVEDKVVAAAENFCRNCGNLSMPNRQLPSRGVEEMGRVCKIFYIGSSGMIERYEAGECGLAMVNGVSGTMTLEGFIPEEREAIA